MRRLSIAFIIVFALNVDAFSQKTVSKTAVESSDSGSRLPVKRIVLYKNGIGYFEHSARVHGNQELTIDFTTAQLNDVLKSLTAVDLGEGHISSVRYNSIAPLNERLRALRLPFGEQVTREDFLLALRGAQVEVKNGSSSATGRLLSVDKVRRSNSKGDFVDVTEFSIVSDAGEMRNFELGPATSVRLAERDLNDEVGRYLSLIGSSRARDLRRMTLSATGTGDRDIFVSYISEVPIWKSTYRIIFSDKANEKPVLQGWAIVDNTVGEDWKDVQLSLIAGAPQSFIQDISQPFYTRRPVVQLPPSVMLTPQAHEGTLEEPGREVLQGSGGGIGSGSGGGVAGGVFQFSGGPALQGTVTDPSGAAVSGAKVTATNNVAGGSQTAVTDARGIYSLYGLAPGSYTLTIQVTGFRTYTTVAYVTQGRTASINARLSLGQAAEVVTVEAEASPVNLSEVASKQHIEAESRDLGDYFEYNLKQKITIGKNQSALVPILQARVDAENVSIWNEQSNEIRRALWLTNSSGLTLDSGTFNIVQGDTVSGEGLLETLHPAERRLISYAADPALRIKAESEDNEKPISRVTISKGIMIATRELRETHTYTLHNSDSQPQQVIIEHPSREGWKLGEGVKPEETTASFLRFRIGVGPNKSEQLKVEEYLPQETRFELASLGDEESKQITLLLADGRISPKLQQSLRKVLDYQNEVAGIESQQRAKQAEVDRITKDQSRVRENMKALKGTPEEKALVQRYTKQLDSQEDSLSSLAKQIDDLQTQSSKAKEKLDEFLQQFAVEESF